MFSKNNQNEFFFNIDHNIISIVLSIPTREMWILCRTDFSSKIRERQWRLRTDRTRTYTVIMYVRSCVCLAAVSHTRALLYRMIQKSR